MTTVMRRTLLVAVALAVLATAGMVTASAWDSTPTITMSCGSPDGSGGLCSSTFTGHGARRLNFSGAVTADQLQCYANISLTLFKDGIATSTVALTNGYGIYAFPTVNQAINKTSTYHATFAGTVVDHHPNPSDTCYGASSSDISVTT